jgi:hypothetical protein
MRNLIYIKMTNPDRMERGEFNSVEDAVKWLNDRKPAEILQEPAKIEEIKEESSCQPVKETKSKKTLKPSKTASPKK